MSIFQMENVVVVKGIAFSFGNTYMWKAGTLLFISNHAVSEHLLDACFTCGLCSSANRILSLHIVGALVAEYSKSVD